MTDAEREQFYVFVLCDVRKAKAGIPLAQISRKRVEQAVIAELAGLEPPTGSPLPNPTGRALHPDDVRVWELDRIAEE